MKSFNELNIKKEIINGLISQDIKIPTKVQEITIPKILDNKDLIVNSQTGSGKTLSFLIPSFERINKEKRETQVIILAPTHELVMQINNEIKKLSASSSENVTSLALIGEVNINKQIKNIKNIKPHIIVGTCGRVLDLIKQRKLKVHTVKTIILDEIDSLLKKDNTQRVKDIVKSTLRERQVIGFSASINDEIISLCSDIMKEFEVIKLDDNKVNPNINHYYIHCDRRDKFTNLRKLIASTNPKRCIVFVNDEDSIDVIREKLNYHNYNACSIFGNMKKEDRQRSLESFRSGKNNILVSSDLSSRGLDIVEISHIFNLDFPINKDEYIHRCGRTSRIEGMEGFSISIITNQNLQTIKKYQKEFKINMVQKELKEGKLVDVKKVKKLTQRKIKK